MEFEETADRFENAARTVQRRRSAIVFLQSLKRTQWGMGVFALLCVLALRRIGNWQSGEWGVALAIIGIWLAGFAVLALSRRPGLSESLLILDTRGRWKDRFTSAWEFLKRPTRTEGETLHISRAEDTLDEAIFNLPKALPIPDLRYSWIIPALALLFALSSFGRIPPEAGDLLLTGEMRDAAGIQAGDLRKSAEQAGNLESLTEEEREELEKLRINIDEVADRLADAEGLTAGEMLDALESRARAAERLAEKMGLGDDAWASEEMLNEMAVHPDTADLSLSIKDKAAEPSALEATKLQLLLENPEITKETEGRMTDALEQIMGAAQEEDFARPVGEKVGNASTKLLNDQPLTAAREFEELAKHFRFLESREKAREKLEDLADSLRDAGSEISGSELQQMEKIASEGEAGGSNPEGLQPINEGSVPEDLKKMLSPQMTQSGASGQQLQPGSSISQSNSENDEGQRNSPVPGQGRESSEGASKNGESITMKAPVPGEPQDSPPGGGQGMSQSDQSQNGSGDGGLLSAPIPGESPQDSSEGGELAMAGGSGGQTGQGGNQAGSGTAELVDSESEAIAASNDSRVAAQINTDGDSTVRAVEGQARIESATRSRQEIMADFIAAEEQALDGQSIPLSRREHVIRYFSEIRRQFEQTESVP